MKYYVMELIDGDECRVSDHDNFDEALREANNYAALHPGLNVSVWSPTAGLMADNWPDGGRPRVSQVYYVVGEP